MIPEKGTFSDLDASRLLLKMAGEKITGILYIKHQETLKGLHFNQGRLVWAISNSVEDKLERVLREKELIDELELRRLKTGKSGLSLGKKLIEKGIITLEQLIICTRIQFTRLVDDLLLWEEGGYQLISSPPPDNLFKLDMDPVSLVFNHVLKYTPEKKVTYLAEDPDLKLTLVEDPLRLDGLGLSQKKTEFINHFNGKSSVSEILGKYASAHHHSLLKVIYFFLKAGLLKEVRRHPVQPEDEPLHRAATPAEINFESEPGVPEHISTAETVVDIDDSQSLPREDFYTFEEDALPDAASENELETEAEPDENTVPLDVDEMLFRDEKEKKQLNWLLILIVAVLVLGGIALLLLLPGSGSSHVPDYADKPQDVRSGAVTEKQKTTDVSEKIHHPAVETVTAEKKNRTDKQAEPDSSGPVTPFEVFQAGKYVQAARLWQKEMRQNPADFAVLLELDCIKQSVEKAFLKLKDKENFYIFPRERSGKTCFLVFWGRFSSETAAQQAVRHLPEYFLKQKPPARVIRLADYL